VEDNADGIVAFDNVVKQSMAKHNVTKQDVAKQNVAKQNVAKQNVAKQDAVKKDAAKQDGAKQNAAKQDAVKQDAAKQDATKQDVTRRSGRARVLPLKWKDFHLLEDENVAFDNVIEQGMAKQNMAKQNVAMQDVAKQILPKENVGHVEPIMVQEEVRVAKEKDEMTSTTVKKQLAVKEKENHPELVEQEWYEGCVYSCPACPQTFTSDKKLEVS